MYPKKEIKMIYTPVKPYWYNILIYFSPFSPFGLFWFTSVYLGLFGPFDPIRSALVYSVHFDQFSPIKPTFVTNTSYIRQVSQTTNYPIIKLRYSTLCAIP